MATQASEYFYVATAQRSTSVTQALCSHFTSAQDVNLIVARRTHLEIYLHDQVECAVPMDELDLYGRIVSMQVLPASVLSESTHRDTDLLLVTTENLACLLLSWDSAKECILVERVLEIKDRAGRLSDLGIVVSADPVGRAFALHVHQGLVKIIPMQHQSKQRMALDSRQQLSKKLKSLHGVDFGKPFDLRLFDELEILSLCLIDVQNQLTLAVLYRDTRGVVRLRLHAILLESEELGNRPLLELVMNDTAKTLVPLTKGACKGLLVIGETAVQFVDCVKTSHVDLKIPMHLFTSHCTLDEEETKFVLGDHHSQLHLLALSDSESSGVRMTMESLGACPGIPSALASLGQGYIYVGSHFGDSSFVKLLQDSDEQGSLVEVLRLDPNLGPIVDMALVNDDQHAQPALVACAGAFENGSLKVIRSGVGISELAELPLPGLKGLWALKESAVANKDSLLLLSFATESRLMRCDRGEIEEYEGASGFAFNEETLSAGNMSVEGLGDVAVQVTTSSVRLISLDPSNRYALLSEWKPEQQALLTHASMDQGHRILVAITGGNVALLSVTSQGSIILVTATTFENDISSLAMQSVSAGKEAQLCTVSTWNDFAVHVLSVPLLEKVTTAQNSEKVLARAALLASLGESHYLFVALADGHLHVHDCTIVHNQVNLSNQKIMHIGTRATSLYKIVNSGKEYVFAASDAPVVFYHRENSTVLSYANVTAKHVRCLSALHIDSAPDSIAYVESSSLKIGQIDDIQRLRIVTVGLGQSPRRIVHQPSSRTLGLIATKITLENRVEQETSYLHIINDTTFDIAVSYKFQPCESAEAICNLSIGKQEFFVVGTATLMSNQQEAESSRIMIFQLADGNKLRLLSETKVNGGLYSLATMQERILAGIGSRVELFKWDASKTFATLDSLAVHYGHIITLKMRIQGDYILVGDLKQSASLLQYRVIEGEDDSTNKEELVELARDESTHWITALEMVGDEVFLCAESSFNLFALKRNADMMFDHQRSRLEPVGFYHLGEQVNVLREGSLMPRQQHSERAETKHFLFGTADGSVGSIIVITEEEYKALNVLQDNLRILIPNSSRQKHSEWRAFKNDYVKMPSTHFIDGDYVEVFLNMDNDEQGSVMRGSSGGQPVPAGKEEVYRMLQNIRRLY